VIVWPAALKLVGLADFATLMALPGTVTVEGGEVAGGPDGGVPVATALLTTEPAVTSVAVVTWVAWHLTAAPGASGTSALSGWVKGPPGLVLQPVVVPIAPKGVSVRVSAVKDTLLLVLVIT
jgi:hypothetical protein